MLYDFIGKLLERVLAPYVEGVSADNLRLGLVRGKIKLQNLKFKRSLFTALGLPILELDRGYLECVEVNAPLTALLSARLEIIVRGLNVVAAARDEAQYDDPSFLAQIREDLCGRVYRLAEQEVEVEENHKVTDAAKRLKGEANNLREDGALAKLIKRFVSNLKVDISDIGVGVKDEQASAEVAARLDSLFADAWDGRVTHLQHEQAVVGTDSCLRKKVGLRGLQVTAGILGSMEQLLHPAGLEVWFCQKSLDGGDVHAYVKLGDQEHSGASISLQQVEKLSELSAGVLQKMMRLKEVLVPAWETESVLLHSPEARRTTEIEFAQLFQREHRKELSLPTALELNLDDRKRLQVLYDVCPDTLLVKWAARVIKDSRNKPPLLMNTVPASLAFCSCSARAERDHELLPEDLVNSLQRERMELDEKVAIPGAISAHISIDDFFVRVLPGSSPEDEIRLELLGGRIDAYLGHGKDHKGVMAPTADVKVDMRGLSMTQGQESVLKFTGQERSNEASPNAFTLSLKNELQTERTVVSLKATGEPMVISLLLTLVPSLKKFPDAEAVKNLMEVGKMFATAQAQQAHDADEYASPEELNSPRFGSEHHNLISFASMQSLSADEDKKVLLSQGAEIITRGEEWLESTDARKALKGAVQRVPDAMVIHLTLSGPIIRVPSMQGSWAEISLGQLKLETPEACTMRDARVTSELQGIGLVVSDSYKLSHEVIKPSSLRADISLRPGFVSADAKLEGLKLNLSIRAAQMLAAVPRSVLLALCLDKEILTRAMEAAEIVIEDIAEEVRCVTQQEEGEDPDGEQEERESTVSTQLAAERLKMKKAAEKAFGQAAADLDEVKEVQELADMWAKTQIEVKVSVDQSTIQLLDFTNPVIRLQTEVPSAWVKLCIGDSRPQVEVDGTLQLAGDIFNLRVGRFEPLIEPFRLNTEFSQFEGICGVKLVGQRPLHLNAAPTTIQALAWYIPDLLSVVFEAWERDPQTKRVERYRAINLSGQTVPLSFPSAEDANDEGAPVDLGNGDKYYCGRFLGRTAAKLKRGKCGPTDGPQCASCQRFQKKKGDPKQDKQSLEPGGCTSLDRIILPSNFKHVEVWCDAQSGGPRLHLNQAGAVSHFVDEGAWNGDVVARLLRPRMDYAILLVSSSCILVNSTSQSLRVRVESRKDLVLPCTECKAADLLRGDLGGDDRSLDCISSQQSIVGMVKTAGFMGNLLQPGEVAGVPSGGMDNVEGNSAKTFRNNRSKGSRGLDGSASNGVASWTEMKIFSPSKSAAAKDKGNLFGHASLELSVAGGNWVTLAASDKTAMNGFCCGDEQNFLVAREVTVSEPPASIQICTIRVLPAMTLLSGLPCACYLEYRLASEPADKARKILVPYLGKAAVYDVPTPNKIAFRLWLQDDDKPFYSGWTTVTVGEEKKDTSRKVIPDALESLIGLSDGSEVDLRGPGGATVTVTLRKEGQVVVHCSAWLVDRTGWKVSVQHWGSLLPCVNDVTLGTHHLENHALKCDGQVGWQFELPTDWGLSKLADGRAVGVRSQLLPEAEVQGCVSTCYELVPWLVLHNKSNRDLSLEQVGKQKVVIAAHKRVTPGLGPGKTWLRVGTKISAAFELRQDLAGSVPILIDDEPWKMEARPERGVMCLVFHEGSSYKLRNMLKEPLSVKVRDGNWILVKPNKFLPIAWVDPTGKDANMKVMCKIAPPLEVAEEFTLDTCTSIPQNLSTKAHTVSRWHGSNTLIEVQPREGGDISSSDLEALARRIADKMGYSKLRLELLVPKAGVSLVGEGDEITGRAHELLYLDLSLLRVCLEERLDEDLRLLEASIGDLQLDHPVLATKTKGANKSSTLRPVVIGNCGHSKSSVYPFFRLVVEQGRIASQDLILKAVRAEIDEVELTAGNKLIEDLQAFVDAATPKVVNLKALEYCSRVAKSASRETSFVSGLVPDVRSMVVHQVLRSAGQPLVVDTWQDPDMQQSVHVEDLRLSDVVVHVWCSIDHKSLMLPKWLSVFLRALTFSTHLALDGSTLKLKQKDIKGAKGSAPQVVQSLGMEYLGDFLHSLGSVLGHSSLLNVPRAPLLLGARVGDAAVKGVSFAGRKAKHAAGYTVAVPKSEGQALDDGTLMVSSRKLISTTRRQRIEKPARPPRHFAGPLAAIVEYSTLEVDVASTLGFPVEVVVPLMFTGEHGPRGREMLRVLVLLESAMEVIDIERPKYSASNIGEIFGEAALIACLERDPSAKEPSELLHPPQQQLMDRVHEDPGRAQTETPPQQRMSHGSQDTDGTNRSDRGSRPSLTHKTVEIGNVSGHIVDVAWTRNRAMIEVRSREYDGTEKSFKFEVPLKHYRGETNNQDKKVVGNSLFLALKRAKEHVNEFGHSHIDMLWGDDWAEAVREAMRNARIRASFNAVVHGGRSSLRVEATNEATKRCVVFEGQWLRQAEGHYWLCPSMQTHRSHRWMDKSLRNRHPLLDPKVDPASATEPPVFLPPMWIAEGTWKKVVDEKTDCDGWKYGPKFLSYNHQDGGTAFRHSPRPFVDRVRVRRWERDYRLDYGLKMDTLEELVDVSWLRHTPYAKRARTWLLCCVPACCRSRPDNQFVAEGPRSLEEDSRAGTDPAT